jgi:hypothetical protein
VTTTEVDSGDGTSEEILVFHLLELCFWMYRIFAFMSNIKKASRASL